LRSYVESLDITCQRAEAAFAAKRQRRQTPAAELEQLTDPMVETSWGRVGISRCRHAFAVDERTNVDGG